MTIRNRLTLWFSGVMFVSLAGMGVLAYLDLVVEPRTRGSVSTAASRESEAEESGAGEVLEILAWCGAPALTLSLGGGWLLMRKALAPVAALTNAAERITEHNLREKLPRTGNRDELDRLTEVFNAMTDRLNDSFIRMREFTLHASHELKTPLTVIHGELETGLQEPGLTVAQRERLESELDEVQRLTKIVDGLAFLTKAGAGQMPLERKPVQLDELMRDAYADAQSLARPRGVHVELTSCEPATVLGDRHRLRQLLLNLTDNAIKYAAPKGIVKMELRNPGEEIEVAIVNDGSGISSETLSRVFEPFFRGDASHSDAIEGCGLGLSIAKWIVTAHGGRIELASTPGKLTTAALRFPKL
jgi:signal transduction histidine kinase